MPLVASPLRACLCMFVCVYLYVCWVFYVFSIAFVFLYKTENSCEHINQDKAKNNFYLNFLEIIIL